MSALDVQSISAEDPLLAAETERSSTERISTERSSSPELVTEASESQRRVFASKVLALVTLVFVYVLVSACLPYLIEDLYDLLDPKRRAILSIGFVVLVVVLAGRFFGKPDRSNTPLYTGILCISTVAAACVFQSIILPKVHHMPDEVTYRMLASDALLGGAVILTSIVLTCFAYFNIVQFGSVAPYIVVVAMLTVFDLLTEFATDLGSHIMGFILYGTLLCYLIFQLQTILRGTRQYRIDQCVAATVEVLFWRDS